MKTLFTWRQARIEFANMIYQEKFKKNDNHCLSEDSFNQLYKVMFTAILMSQKNQTDYEYVRLITKSTFHYYKYDEKTKSIYYIFQEITRRKGTFEIWRCENFWLDWFENEIEETHNSFTEIEDFYFNNLLALSSKMNELKIDKDYIVICIIDNIAKKYIQDKILLEDLKVAVTKMDYY